MKTRILVAAIFVPIIFVILFFLPPVWLTGMMALISMLIAFELLRATGAAANVRIYIYTVLIAGFMPFGVYLEIGDIIFRASLFVLMALLFAEAIFAFAGERRIRLADVLTALFAGVLIPYSLSVMVGLKMMPNGKLYVLLPILTTFISDSGAYFVGKFFGKHQAFPHVSPHKTLEGCGGGLACNVIGMMLYGLILLIAKIPANFLLLALYGVCGNLVTQLGDLAFSFIKREYGIKDYGHLLPGHGGMLDRFDSLIFAAPVLYLLVVLLPAF